MVGRKFKPHKMRRSTNGKGTVNKHVQFRSTSHVAIRHFKFDIKSGYPHARFQLRPLCCCDPRSSAILRSLYW